MDLQHVNVKILLDGDFKVDLARFIEVFHGWIQDKKLDELIIDVADYRHVPAGPGVLLVGLESDYSIDHSGHRPGLRYNRRAPLDGTNADRLTQALSSAARACQLLEAEFTGEETLRFSRQEFEIYFNDRGLVPNTPEMLAACRAEIEAFLADKLGHREFTLEPSSSDPRSRLGFAIRSSRPFDLAAIQ